MTDNSSHKESNLVLLADYRGRKIGITHYFAIALWVGWYGMYFYLPLWVPLLYYVAPWLLAAIFAILFVSFILPIDELKQPAWTQEINKFIMIAAADYFQVRIFAEDAEALHAQTPAIFSVEPHDVLPFSCFAFSEHLGYFPTHHGRIGMTDAVFLAPAMRHMFTWNRAVSVSKKSLNKSLNRGHSPIICPGGVQEVALMATAKEKEIILYLKSRQGHIRLAAERGISVIPCYCFGQKDLFVNWIPKGDLVTYLGRKIGFIPILYCGAFNIPFGIPKPLPLVLVVGKPIPVPKREQGLTPEEVQKYVDLFVEGTRRIFEENKDKFGYTGYTLTIL